MKLKIPFYYQDTPYTCGPASLQMVLSFLGDFESEIRLLKEAHTRRKTGTTHQNMINVARKEGFFCYVNGNSSIFEIKHFIKLGLPVIINVTSDNEGHYAVIIGFSKKRLIINDPWYGKNLKMREGRVESVWHDSLTKSNRWIMVLSKDDLRLGKQYLPLKKEKLSKL